VNWKIAMGGLTIVVALLLFMSLSGVIWGFTGGTVHVDIPGKASLREVKMYGGTYEGKKSVIIQEIPGSLKCLRGQVIKRRLGLPGTDNVVIKFNYASLQNVKMYATQLVSPSGTMENLEMSLRKAKRGCLLQRIQNAQLDDLKTNICFVSIGSLTYRGLSIYFEP